MTVSDMPRTRDCTCIERIDEARIVATMRALLAARAADATLCPSEVARALSHDDAIWRSLMPRVREVAIDFARRGEARITQRGITVDPDRLPPGPIRIAHPRAQ